MVRIDGQRFVQDPGIGIQEGADLHADARIRNRRDGAHPRRPRQALPRLSAESDLRRHGGHLYLRRPAREEHQQRSRRIAADVGRAARREAFLVPDHRRKRPDGLGQPAAAGRTGDLSCVAQAVRDGRNGASRPPRRRDVGQCRYRRADHRTANGARQERDGPKPERIRRNYSRRNCRRSAR